MKVFALSLLTLALAACDSFDTVDGPVEPDDLMVERVEITPTSGDRATLRVHVRNDGTQDFGASSSVVVTIRGEGQDRFAGDNIPGGLAVGEQTVVTGTFQEVTFDIECYEYAVTVQVDTRDQSVGRSAEYPGTCGSDS